MLYETIQGGLVNDKVSIFYGDECRLVTSRKVSSLIWRMHYITPMGKRDAILVHGARNSVEAKQLFRFSRFL
jgi:hypothetical protein